MEALQGDYKFVFFRMLVVAATIWISLCLPNVHAVLALTGSVAGTLIAVVVPIMFYNKAYSGSFKGEIEEGEEGEDQENEEDKAAGVDSRKWLKRLNWVVLFVGVVIGVQGLVATIAELHAAG